jgi:predicted Zn-ribbon and HTH transcriptional regulator
MEATTRERIADRLRAEPATPSALAAEFDVGPHSAVEHVRHLARSLDAADEQLQVAPPTCEDCGFDRFDDPANLPSRCPDCKHEAVTEPVFRIE